VPLSVTTSQIPWVCSSCNMTTLMYGIFFAHCCNIVR
jgi:hypothetical protein